MDTAPRFYVAKVKRSWANHAFSVVRATFALTVVADRELTVFRTTLAGKRIALATRIADAVGVLCFTIIVAQATSAGAGDVVADRIVAGARIVLPADASLIGAVAGSAGFAAIATAAT